VPSNVEDISQPVPAPKFAFWEEIRNGTSALNLFYCTLEL